MWGIVTVIHADTSSDSAVADLHDAAYLLQHHGQDTWGIATSGFGGKSTLVDGRNAMSAES